MKEPDLSEVPLLREKTLWRDVKGRTLLVLQRWHKGSGAKYQCVEVDIFLIEEKTLIRRTYQEVTELILCRKMTFISDLIVSNPK